MMSTAPSHVNSRDTAAATASVLSVVGLRHCYARGAAFSFPDLALNAGETLILRGPSGVGKSTFLHLIVGALRIAPNSGAVVVAGTPLQAQNPSALDAMRPHIVGWMPQRTHLISSLTVLDNVLIPLSMSGTLDDAARMRARVLMSDAGIEHIDNQPTTDISVGQAARTCLIRALLARPKLLVIDEPTASLDEQSSRSLCRMISSYVADGGAALIASHDPMIEMQLRELDANTVNTLTLSAANQA
jgi:putative ABC transport system ATP-binding protein